MPSYDPTERTKKAILETGLRLFQEYGWKNVKIDDIVRELGLTRGAFYHNFKSRADLIDQIGDMLFESENPFVTVKQETSLNGLQKLQKAIRLSLNMSFNQISMMDGGPSVIREMFDGEMLFRKELMWNVNHLGAYIEDLIREGVADQSITTHNPKYAGQVFGLLSFWFSPFIFHVTNEEYLEKLDYLRHLGGLMGIPLIDDEVCQYLQDFVENFDFKTFTALS